MPKLAADLTHALSCRVGGAGQGRFGAVQRGLGEMQQLASDVGSLQRVLTNVKKRGTFGETQLGALLEDVLTPDQYASNVATLPGSSESSSCIRMSMLSASSP